MTRTYTSDQIFDLGEKLGEAIERDDKDTVFELVKWEIPIILLAFGHRLVMEELIGDMFGKVEVH